VLLRRLGLSLNPVAHVDVRRPIRTSRDRIIKEGQIERAVALARANAEPDGVVMVILDADDECPKDVAPPLLARARARLGDFPVSVVLAKREFESWFIAASTSLRGVRGLAHDLAPVEDPETVQGAKEWLAAHMPVGRRYRETLDQAAMSAAFDLVAARRAPSFDKLVRDFSALVSARTV
jgi:hypothetical protein